MLQVLTWLIKRVICGAYSSAAHGNLNCWIHLIEFFTILSGVVLKLLPSQDTPGGAVIIFLIPSITISQV